MNFLTAGFHEIARRCKRASDRSRLKRELPGLEQAEIFLGQLGWQQAEDFPPDVEKQIHAINALEHEQAEFSNRSAGIQGSIEQLESQREANRAAHESLLAEINARLQPLIQSRGELADPLPNLKQGVGRFEKAIADLGERYHASGPMIAQLKNIRPQTYEMRQEMARLEDFRIGYDAEKEELQRARRKLINQIKSSTSEIASLDKQIKSLNKKIEAAAKDMEAREKEHSTMIASLQHDKSASSRTVDQLDAGKSPAYLAIGRCLADFNIPPMNQPEALSEALSRRETVRGLQRRIADSQAASSQTSRVSLAVFFIVVILLLAALAAAVFTLNGGGHAGRIH